VGEKCFYQIEQSKGSWYFYNREDGRYKLFRVLDPSSNHLMSKKKKRESAQQAARRLQRKLALQQGYYDGRFRERTVKDKKKEAKKRWARRKNGEEA
jgi:hypothetical protein